MAKKIISIYIDEKLLLDIDKTRGIIKRSNFIEALLEKSMGERR